jgi:PIN domain nuclease of toxin-antitoxin system
LSQLSDTAKEALEANTLLASLMVTLELDYLNEIGRLCEPSERIMSDLHDRIGFMIDTASFALVVDQAVQITWTRDPFDRLITAQAAVYKNNLLTKDETIRKNYSQAIW